MSDQNAFIWAQGQEANVKEPIQALKERGWHYGDVPTASNFNWLFKTLTQEIASLRKELSVQKEEFTNALAEQAESHENKLSTKAGKLDAKFSRLSDRHDRASKFNEGISRQICMMLSEMEKCIRHYHKDFPTLPWPLQNKTEDDCAS